VRQREYEASREYLSDLIRTRFTEVLSFFLSFALLFIKTHKSTRKYRYLALDKIKN
jgi:succinate dehydrogenase hydrophobic anchor subunit